MENNRTTKTHVLIDDKLSLKAKGLYMLIKMHLIVDGNIKKSELIELSKDGKDSFHAAWKELKEAGYLIQSRDSENKMKYKYELK